MQALAVSGSMPALSERLHLPLCRMCARDHDWIGRRRCRFQSSSDNRYLELALQSFVENCTDDDVGIVADLVANAGRGFIYFKQRHVHAARYRDQHTLCALH